MDILGFDVGYVRTPDPANKNLIVRVARGLSSRAFLSTAFPIDSPYPIVGKKVFETRKGYIGRDIRKDRKFKTRTLEHEEGVISLAMFPIASKQRPMGFLAVGNKSVHEFREREINLGKAFSFLVSGSLEKVEGVSRLRRFLPPQLADLILSDAEPLKTQRREIAVVSVDLRGFTAFVDTSEAEDVDGVLREYYAEMGKLIRDHQGVLEGTAGDGIMVFFNALSFVPDAGERAIRMAWAMRERLKDLVVKWRKLGYKLDFGVGIDQGYAIVGPRDFQGQWVYGASGRVTNLAFRLCGQAKAGEILITERLLGAVDELVEAGPAVKRTLKGFDRPIPAHTILRLKG